MSLESLYQQIILDHYKNPRNFGEAPGCAVSVEHENPLCGDHLKVAINVADGHITEIKFSGKGCAISQASASMMTETMKGRPVEEARSLVEEFRRMMRGDQEFAALDEAGEMEALKGVLQFPVRIKCAVLAWDALESCLRGL
ncbi:MAG: SUF system NifU family Fe-S cluster assembly protein [Armatimonadetes bacterium]|nr:SUF system NifU family Fe-S cluster assembly protein [Armatimonadota bacterium]